MAVRKFQTLLMVNALLDTSALREAMFPRPAHEGLLQIPREIKMCLIVNRAVQDIIAIQMPSLLKRENVTLVMFASWVSHFYRINTVSRTLRHFIYAKILFLRHTIIIGGCNATLIGTGVLSH